MEAAARRYQPRAGQPHERRARVRANSTARTAVRTRAREAVAEMDVGAAGTGPVPQEEDLASVQGVGPALRVMRLMPAVAL